MGSKSLLNKALNQMMKLQVVKVAAVTSERQTMRGATRVPVGMQPPPAKYHKDGLLCWLCVMYSHLSNLDSDSASRSLIAKTVEINVQLEEEPV